MGPRAGLPLDPKVLLSPEVSEAFLAGQAKGTTDMRSWLRRLARAHGIGVAETPVGYKWRPAPKPYSDEECAALVGYARSITNRFRRDRLALLALGLGCGLASTGLRGVTASDVHRHGREQFMRSGVHCAKVRSNYAKLLEEVCLARPEGELVSSKGKNVTTEIVAWASERVGVPKPVRRGCGRPTSAATSKTVRRSWTSWRGRACEQSSPSPSTSST